MPSASTASSRTSRGGAVGPSGTNGKVNTVKIRNVDLVLPKTVPLRILKQLGEIADKGADATLNDMVEALEMVLGKEQMERLWDIELGVTKNTVDALQTLFGEAIDKVFAAAGITPGE